MKLHYSESEETNELFLDWQEKNRMFGIWFDDTDGGWYFVEREPPEDTNLDDICGSIDKDILEKIYNKIGKILGRESND